MKVLCVKLTTGEELASQVEEKDGFYELKNPIRLLLTPQGISTMPFLPYCKDGITVSIDKAHVMFTAELDLEVLNAYNQQYGSGIVLAAETPTFKLST